MQAPARPFIAGGPLPYPLVPPAPVQERQQGPRGSYKISSEAPDFDCPVCLNTINTPENKIMTSCNHAFCGDCISHLQSLAQENACIKCPMCRLYLKRPKVPLAKIPLAKIRRELLVRARRTPLVTQRVPLVRIRTLHPHRLPLLYYIFHVSL